MHSTDVIEHFVTLVNTNSSDLLNIDPNILFELIEQVYGLSKVQVDLNILVNLDLSIVQFEYDKFLLFKKKSPKDYLLFEIPISADLLKDSVKLDRYCKIVMSDKRNTLKPDNFFISEDSSVILSRDFRVIIRDLRGNIPKAVMLNSATVALLTISGAIEFPIGYGYITSIMNTYGSKSFFFKMEGYLRIEIGKEPDVDFKSWLSYVPKEPGSL